MVELHKQEMRSVSDFLVEMNSCPAKRAKPTIGEKMPRWAKRFRWGAHDWEYTPELGSRTGGGKQGIGATEKALTDIYSLLQ